MLCCTDMLTDELHKNNRKFEILDHLPGEIPVRFYRNITHEKVILCIIIALNQSNTHVPHPKWDYRLFGTGNDCATRWVREFRVLHLE